MDITPVTEIVVNDQGLIPLHILLQQWDPICLVFDQQYISVQIQAKTACILNFLKHRTLINHILESTTIKIVPSKYSIEKLKTLTGNRLPTNLIDLESILRKRSQTLFKEWKIKTSDVTQNNLSQLSALNYEFYYYHLEYEPENMRKFDRKQRDLSKYLSNFNLILLAGPKTRPLLLESTKPIKSINSDTDLTPDVALTMLIAQSLLHDDQGLISIPDMP